MIPNLVEQVGQAAVYVVNAGGGAKLNAVRELMIVLLGIEAGAAGGGRDACWLQLQVVKHNGVTLTATVLVDDPLLTPEHTGKARVLRYIYQEGDHQPIEYVNGIRGGAFTTVFGLLPNFFPAFEKDDLEKTLFPDSGKYLGHKIEKKATRKVDAHVPRNVLRLELDPEMLVGTGRNCREVEGRRVWTGDEYQYRTFEKADYDEMIDAGINYFWVDRRQEEWVRNRPVFFLKWHGNKPDYPEMFYRANCRGISMFMDEPAVHMAWFFQRHGPFTKTLSGPAGAARFLEARVRDDIKTGNYSQLRLHDMLRNQYDLGDMTIRENHYPAWETMEWSVYYQMKAGLPGAVHEGRYTNKADVNVFNAEYDTRIPDTPENNMRIRYAWFRGAARMFKGDWGTAIYGQCEESVAPLAVTMAWDMGARYVWYWTSDRLHHMPYAEQLALTRHLREHARKNPRKPLAELNRAARAVILLPDGYVLTGFHMYETNVFHLDRINEKGLRYRDVLKPAALQMERYLKESIPFDIIYNDGTPGWEEYDEAVIVGEDGSARWYKKGQHVGDPPLPQRTPAELASKAPVIRIRHEQPAADAAPLSVKLIADIDNDGKPVGLRTRDWGTPNWTYMEAFWRVYDDLAEPRFHIGRTLEHTFRKPGAYRITAWTCNEDGVAGRTETTILVEDGK
ncbi:MAG TPA: hypothetical protein PLL20_12310 [Phycisphaerae bacterium]|nr:hypothetical protein [Phycisphaerae bacterium]HRR87467.1 hypothetical protein [Phycisphaerae bacterium]